MAKAIHMMVRVQDEARSVDFYDRAFGMRIADRFDFDDFTLVYLRNSENDFEVELTVNKGREQPYQHGDGYGHVAFAVADLGVEWSDVPLLIAGQFLGAFIGAILVWLAYLVHWGETEDPGLKLAVFSTGPAIRNTAANLITEIIGTFMLVFGVVAIFENEAAAALGAFFVGLLVLGIGMALGGPTGYAINPARDLGPRIIHAIVPIPGKGTSDWEYSWIPVVGPVVGGVIGALAAKAIFDL